MIWLCYNFFLIIIGNSLGSLWNTNEEVMERIGEERALISARNKKEKGNGVGTPWKETH